MPDAPFSSLTFDIYQICQSADGLPLEAIWTPELLILPRRHAGWNKFTLSEDITDPATFFSDALIIWKGDAAYSANPTTAELIAETPGVSALTELKADDEIWVKY